MVRAAPLAVFAPLAAAAAGAGAAAAGRQAGPKYMLLDSRNVHSADAALVLGRVQK
eukprot:COSAG04_NODE_24506_length_320_cov_234.628959_1_plen_55_part_10